MPDDLKARLVRVCDRIETAARAAGRSASELTLIAVAKTRSAAEVRAMATAGVRDIGENYLQEALAKQAELADLALTWHFIGAVQANKTRAVSEHFDWVHSVDRLRILRRLGEQRPPDRGPLNVCLQVNLDEEASKAGVAADALPALVAAAAEVPNIRLRGLMALPAARHDPEAQREPFRRLAALARQLEVDHPGLTLDVLSIGMSDDLEAAIAEGATHLRIGTALFGPRPPAHQPGPSADRSSQQEHGQQ